MLTAARALVPELVAVHPEISEKKGDGSARDRRESPSGGKPAARSTSATRTAKKRKTGKKAATGSPDLFAAVLANDKKRLQKITRKDLAARDERGRSLLFMAVLAGRTEWVERLIALGANVDPKSPKDRAPLLAAALRNRPKETKLLLEAGAKPALAQDEDGDPVLVTAAFREATAVVRELCKVPQESEHLSLALLEAAGVGNLPIVKLLVKHGADPHWVSRRGNSALSIARKKRRREVVAYLKSLKRK